MARPKNIVGIDIGSSKVATIVASYSEEDQKVKIVGVSSVLSKGISKGQIVNIEEASESITSSIESAERMAGFDLSEAVISLGGPHISSQNSKGIVAVAEPEGEINQTDVQRVIEAARAISVPSTREIVHVIPRSFTVDGQPGVKDPVGMSGTRLEIDTNIITGSSTAIRNLVKCVSEMSVGVSGLVFSGLAAAESSLTPTEKELGVILVDIGGGTTDIVIYVDGAPFYASCLPVGGKNVTSDLAIGLRMPLDMAEKIKIALSEEIKRPVLPVEEEKNPRKKIIDEDEIDLTKLGIEGESKTVSRKTLVEGIIKPRLQEILDLVSQEIVRSEAVGLTPSGVVITGGGAKTIGVLEAAKKNLSMPARIGEPQQISGLIDDVQSPDFAAAVGLVLYTLKTGEKSKSGHAFGRTQKKSSKFQVKGAAGRVIGIIKSFLP